jgi:hypothetical protein
MFSLSVLLECRRVRANLIHQRRQIPAIAPADWNEGANHGATVNFGFRVAEKPLAELIQEGDPPIARPAQDDAVGQHHQLAVFLFAFAQRPFRLPARGDVAGHEHHLGHPSLGVSNHAAL